MENYEVLEQLKKEGLSNVSLVRHKIRGDTHVLKKVECPDEGAANKAFCEAQAVPKLCHPYVCGYKDFFVSWVQEDSSVFFCTVMTHYPKGNLKSLLQAYRRNRRLIDEYTAKRFLGEITEALIFVHDKGIIHRNLKPSNIFIKEDGSLVVGDFAVATIISDTMTCSRCPTGISTYMAPEVIPQYFTERSDVWSLGCILLEIVTTAMFDSFEDVEKMLISIREDSAKISEIYRKVAEDYSPDMAATIQMLLCFNEEHRPTARDLPVRSTFVSWCLESCNAAALEKRRRQEETRHQIKDISTSEHPSFLSVLENIAQGIDHEKQVASGLKHLRDMTKGELGVSLDEKSIHLVAAAMKNNLNDKNVQLHGFGVLHNLVVRTCPCSILFSPEVISAVPLAMRNHPSDAQIQQAAASLLMAMAAYNKASEIIGSFGGINCLVAALQALSTNPDVCAACCSALWCLTVNENNGRIAAGLHAVEHIAHALKSHLMVPDVAECAAAALIPVCLEDSNFEHVNNLNCVGLLLQAMLLHVKSVKIVKNCCLALAGLVESDEESAYRILSNEIRCNCETLSGIHVMVRAYELHKDNADVVETIIVLLKELTVYSDLRTEMVFLHVGAQVLSEISKRYRDNTNIMDPCETAMEKLSLHDKPASQDSGSIMVA